MSLLPGARFHTTVAQVRQLPRGNIPELAFVGRSNAGKSSAINALCGRRKLAFASNTPGRTQALNYFALGREPAIDAFLVDMPGYGYAVADRASKAAWGELSVRYLSSRQPLAVIVLVVDMRRGIGPLDQTLIDWVRAGQRLLVLATKSDKLNRSEQFRAVRAIRDTLSLRSELAEVIWSVIPLSVTSGNGLEEARRQIDEWLGEVILATQGASDSAGPPQARDSAVVQDFTTDTP